MHMRIEYSSVMLNTESNRPINQPSESLLEFDSLEITPFVEGGDGAAIPDDRVALDALQVSSDFTFVKESRDSLRPEDTLDAGEASCRTNCPEK